MNGTGSVRDSGCECNQRPIPGNEHRGHRSVFAHGKSGKGIKQAAAELQASEQGFLNACDGILTTDIGRKVAERTFTLNGRETHIVGMCKGAGMIGPKMATMLAIIITDAPMSESQAQRILQAAANKSFNCISVEGHMSTNDSLVLLAAQTKSRTARIRRTGRRVVREPINVTRNRTREKDSR